MGQQMFNPQQNFNEQNNNIFNADSFNNDINISSISENDVPPDLPPIKNLSDANIDKTNSIIIKKPNESCGNKILNRSFNIIILSVII